MTITEQAAKTLVGDAVARADEVAVADLPTHLNLLAVAGRIAQGHAADPLTVTFLLDELANFGSNVAVLHGGKRASWRVIRAADIDDLVGLDDCRHGDVTDLEWLLGGHYGTVADLLAAFEAVAA